MESAQLTPALGLGSKLGPACHAQKVIQGQTIGHPKKSAAMQTSRPSCLRTEESWLTLTAETMRLHHANLVLYDAPW